MSIEYFAAANLDQACTQAVLRALQSDGRFQLLPSSNAARILFRVTQNPVRETWPEDAEIRFQDGGISVAFHSASAPDRSAFIQILETTLNVRFAEE